MSASIVNVLQAKKKQKWTDFFFSLAFVNNQAESQPSYISVEARLVIDK